MSRERTQRHEIGIISVSWQHFSASLILAVMFPLLPLGIELWTTETVSRTTLLIVSIMYTVSALISSRSVLMLTIGIVISILFSVQFGIVLSGEQTEKPLVTYACIVVIIVFGSVRMIDRYNAHIVRGEDFLSFNTVRRG